MTQAQMIVAVVAARLATGGALSPLTARAFAEVARRRRAYPSSAAAGCGAAGAPRAASAPRGSDLCRRLELA